MNSQKIRELCARAMGWQLKEFGLHTVLYGSGETWIHADDYDPLIHADQASELLETVADELGCSWSCGYNILADGHWCELPTAAPYVPARTSRLTNLRRH